MSQGGPLQGLRILDFSTLLPGPYATMLLADLGAEVLHVEAPARPDLVRLFPPYANGQSTAHAYLNRNKASLALDLKQPAAVAAVQRLLADYDIVVEGFRPGVMARLGLGYEQLAAINPRLIYCAITGYGQDGPYRDRAGHDLNYLALAGVLGHSGRASEGPPPLGIQVADVAGGSLHAVIAILAAVIERQRSGLGQQIDISMTDCAFALNAMAAAAWLAGGQAQPPEGGLLNGGSFYGCYPTADGQWLSIAGLEPAFLQTLCQQLAMPELAALGLSQQAADQARLRAALRAAIAAEPLAHWQHVFSEIDACVEPVLSLADAAASPLATARRWQVRVPSAGGEQAQPANPLKFSRSQVQYRQAGGALGEGGDAALLAAGLSAEEIAELRRSGALR